MKESQGINCIPNGSDAMYKIKLSCRTLKKASSDISACDLGKATHHIRAPWDKRNYVTERLGICKLSRIVS